ncbi:unnamed protein product, partial [Scytosiphon promiscuus]
RRGVLLFVDEADAFLRRRSTEVSLGRKQKRLHAVFCKYPFL